MQAGGDSCLQQAISYSLLFVLPFVLYTLMDGQNDGRLANSCHEQNVTTLLSEGLLHLLMRIFIYSIIYRCRIILLQ